MPSPLDKDTHVPENRHELSREYPLHVIKMEVLEFRSKTSHFINCVLDQVSSLEERMEQFSAKDPRGIKRPALTLDSVGETSKRQRRGSGTTHPMSTRLSVKSSKLASEGQETVTPVKGTKRPASEPEDQAVKRRRHEGTTQPMVIPLRMKSSKLEAEDPKTDTLMRGVKRSASDWEWGNAKRQNQGTETLHGIIEDLREYLV